MTDLSSNVDHFLINIILSTSGSSGDKINFQYPSDAKDTKHSSTLEIKRDNYLSSTILNIKSESCNQPFLIKVDGLYFAGFPGLLYHDEYKIKLLNITFVYQQSHTSHGNRWEYQSLSKLLAIAFRAEHNINGYMSLMINLMSQIWEEISMEKESFCYHNPYDQMLHKGVPICGILAKLYNDLVIDHNLNVMINENTFFAFTLTNSYYLMSENYTNLKSKSCNFFEDIKAYHSLIFIEDINCLNKCPLNFSRIMQKMLKIYSPTKNFFQMAKAISISIYHIINIAKQLILWDYCMLIYPVCENNIYVISPLAVGVLNSKLSTKFSTTFGHSVPNLHLFLMQFHIPFDLKYHFHPLSNSFFNFIKHKEIKLKIICWLIKHRLIIQLHNYVYLFETEYDTKLEMASFKNPGNLGAKESNINSYSEKSFNRLVPYLNGKHHIEEIMFINKLKRSTLLHLLEKHKNNIIVVTHQDPITMLPPSEGFVQESI